MPACLLVNVGLLGLLALLPLFSSLWRAFHTVFFKYRTKTMLSFSFTLTRAFMYVQWLPSICYLVLQSWAKLSMCQKQAALPSRRYLWLLGAGFPCSWKERPILWFIICLSFLCLNERNLCFLWEGQGQWKVVPFLIKRLRTLCQWQVSCEYVFPQTNTLYIYAGGLLHILDLSCSIQRTGSMRGMPSTLLAGTSNDGLRTKREEIITEWFLSQPFFLQKCVHEYMNTDRCISNEKERN